MGGSIFITISLVVTIGATVLGLLLGLLRGFSRGLVRFILILASIVLAQILCKTFAKTVLDSLLGGGLGIEDSGMPQVLVETISGTILVLIEVVLFIAVVVVLLIITWLVIFPLLKLILRAFGKRKSGVSRIIGGVLGLVGGAVVAFSIMVPFTGIVNQVDEVAKIKLNGEPLLGEVDVKPLDDYVESPLGRFYLDTGKGIFSSMTSFVGSNGEERTLEGSIQATVAMTGIYEEIGNISSVDLSSGLNAENTETLVQSLNKLEQIKGEMGEEAKELVNQVFAELVDSLGEETEVLPENLDFYELNFASVADAMEIIQAYNDAGGESPMTDDEVTTVVGAFANNLSMLDVVGRGAVLVNADDVTKAKITVEVDSYTELSQADKDDIKKLFGIEIVAE